MDIKKDKKTQLNSQKDKKKYISVQNIGFVSVRFIRKKMVNRTKLWFSSVNSKSVTVRFGFPDPFQNFSSVRFGFLS